MQIAHAGDQRIKRLAGKIDRVLVDGRLLGLGTLRRNPDLKVRQSPKAVQELEGQAVGHPGRRGAAAQTRGRSFYATCLLASENESVCEAFAQDHPGFVPMAVDALLTELKIDAAESPRSAGHLRLWPHLHATDGSSRLSGKNPDLFGASSEMLLSLYAIPRLTRKGAALQLAIV